jgi:hypothetical protein
LESIIPQVRFVYNGNAFLLFLWFWSLFDILDAPEKSRLQMGGGFYYGGGFNCHLQWYVCVILTLQAAQHHHRALSTTVGRSAPLQPLSTTAGRSKWHIRMCRNMMVYLSYPPLWKLHHVISYENMKSFPWFHIWIHQITYFHICNHQIRHFMFHDFIYEIMKWVSFHISFHM